MEKYPKLQETTFVGDLWEAGQHLVLKPKEDTDSSCLEALLEITENLGELFENHPDIDEDEPWFGWAFERASGLQGEIAFMESVVKTPDLRSKLEVYVKRVINYFKETDAYPGFYVHEEKEAASDAILNLVKADKDKYFPLFLEYLKAVDLEHTVAQSDNVHIIKDMLSEAQVIELVEVLESTSGGEYILDVFSI